MARSVKKLVYTVTEAAEACGVSRPTMYRWMHIPGFPVRKIGGCTRILVRELEAWLRSQNGEFNNDLN